MKLTRYMLGLLGAFLLWCIVGLSGAAPASAATCLDTGVGPGAVAYTSGTNCYIMTVNSDGSINTTTTLAPASGAPTVGGALIGVTSAQLLAAGTRVYVSVQNVSAAAMVACRWGGTAILNDINSFMLVPGGSKTYEGSYVPSATALNCISNTASTPVYAEVK